MIVETLLIVGVALIFIGGFIGVLSESENIIIIAMVMLVAAFIILIIGLGIESAEIAKCCPCSC